MPGQFISAAVILICPKAKCMYHLIIVEPVTYALLKEIFRIEIINKQFALAGSTSLALQIGHRRSIDLVIFSVETFNPKEIEITLAAHPHINFQPTGGNSKMLFGFANNIKCVGMIC